jgi:hypothetical protein
MRSIGALDYLVSSTLPGRIRQFNRSTRRRSPSEAMLDFILTVLGLIGAWVKLYELVRKTIVTVINLTRTVRSSVAAFIEELRKRKIIPPKASCPNSEQEARTD